MATRLLQGISEHIGSGGIHLSATKINSSSLLLRVERATAMIASTHKSQREYSCAVVSLGVRKG